MRIGALDFAILARGYLAFGAAINLAGPNRSLLAIGQLISDPAIMHPCSCSLEDMYCVAFSRQANMRLHLELPVVTLSRRRHIRVSYLGLVLGRRRCIDDCRIHQRARAQRDAFVRQICACLGEERLCQPSAPEGARRRRWSSLHGSGYRPLRSRQTGVWHHFPTAFLRLSGRSGRNNSAGSTCAACSLAAPEAARPSAQPSGNEARSAPVPAPRKLPHPSLPETTRVECLSSSSRRKGQAVWA